MINYIEILKARIPPSQIVVSDASQTFTLAEIERRCQKLIAVLQAKNIKRLGVYAENGVDWIVADIACQIIGISFLPLPTFFSEAQLKHVFSSCPVDAVLTDSSEILTVVLDKSNIACVDVDASALSMLVLKNDFVKASLPAGTGKITFTSGSTGQPKGVCLSNEQLNRQAQALAQMVALDSPKHLCLLPLSTLLENVAGIYAPLIAAGELVVPKLSELGFKGSSLEDKDKLLNMINKTQPSSIILIPQLLLFLVGAVAGGWQPPSSLKFVAVGGSKVAKDLLLKARGMGLPVYEGYGLSECASVVSLNTQGHNKDGSCGKPLPHVKLSVDNGEVVVSSSAMLGYINAPESWNLTEIRTGDLGNVDDEGFLHIEGRKKNVLISSYGRNISPEWIESELLINPLLMEAVVFGDALPYCCALLSPRFNGVQDADIQDWIDSVNLRLPDYARVLAWLRLPEPLNQNKALMTENGRPKRQEIQAAYKAEIEAFYHLETT